MIDLLVLNLQKALLDEGLDPGPIDGVMGNRTYQAALAFQKRGALKAPVITKQGWRLAKSLDILLKQLNTAYPDRNKSEDGTIGDTAHQERTSDHNPWINDPDGSEVVSALDITHDPVHGCDCNRISKIIILDPRIKYVIWNKQIYNPSISKKWRPYKGANAHDKHMHVSVNSDKKYYDDVAMWNLA
jgi:peptidoglycan hydrolase-like protein with peptidoglycan-binding domain